MTAPNVIAFPSPDRNTFDDAWALLTPLMKRRSDGKTKLRELWNREAKRLGGQSELLDRLKRYIAASEEIRRKGGVWGEPALQVILRSQRLENYEAEQTLVNAEGGLVNAFPNEAVRSALLRRCGAEWIASYLDPCSIDGTSVVARTDYAVKKLLEHREVFKMAGFTGIKKRVG